MLKLLEALLSQPQHWRHGYDLMKESDLQSGTVYPLLMRMADQGLVDAQWCEPERPGRPARHAYRLTSTGLAFALAQTSRTSAPSVRGMAV